MSPNLKCDIDKLERVLRIFTKRMPALSNMTYENRLHALGAMYLENRHLYFDLMLMYKIIHGI